MPDDRSDQERAHNFIYDPATDRIIFALRPGMRLVRGGAGDGGAQYRIECWGRLPDDLAVEVNRWITTHTGPRSADPAAAIEWACAAIDQPPERPFIAMGLL